MNNAVTDTHALIWYLQDSSRLGAGANQVFDACDRGEVVIYVPTICLVEIIYLQEKNRISSNLKLQLDAEFKTGNSGFVIADLTVEVVNFMEQIPRQTVPDLPDRIIAATALCLGLPLISRDSKIRLSTVNIIW